jgi:hypothetical protein
MVQSNKVMNGTQTINGNRFPNINHGRRDHMDKNKEKTQTYAGSFQGVADDRQNKIDELKEKNHLDDETEYYARIFLEL